MRIIYYEFKMDFLRTIRYKMGIVSDIVVFTILLCFFYISNTGASFQKVYGTNNYKTLLLLGYIAWTLAVSAISTIGNQITSELQRGTLFFKLNCKLPLQIVYIGDLVSASIIQLFIIFIYSIVTHFAFGVDYFVSPAVLVSLIICTFGMYGIGLIVAGLSIYFKRIGSIILLIQLFLLFVTNTVPTASIITNVSKILPLTMCNTVLRLSFSNENIYSSFVLLLLTSIFWFALGYIVFGLFIKFSKKKGNLLLY